MNLNTNAGVTSLGGGGAAEAAERSTWLPLGVLDTIFEHAAKEAGATNRTGTGLVLDVDGLPNGSGPRPHPRADIENDFDMYADSSTNLGAPGPLSGGYDDQGAGAGAGRAVALVDTATAPAAGTRPPAQRQQRARSPTRPHPSDGSVHEARSGRSRSPSRRSRDFERSGNQVTTPWAGHEGYDPAATAMVGKSSSATTNARATKVSLSGAGSHAPTDSHLEPEYRKLRESFKENYHAYNDTLSESSDRYATRRNAAQRSFRQIAVPPPAYPPPNYTNAAPTHDPSSLPPPPPASARKPPQSVMLSDMLAQGEQPPPPPPPPQQQRQQQQQQQQQYQQQQYQQQQQQYQQQQQPQSPPRPFRSHSPDPRAGRVYDMPVNNSSAAFQEHAGWNDTQGGGAAGVGASWGFPRTVIPVDSHQPPAAPPAGGGEGRGGVGMSPEDDGVVPEPGIIQRLRLSGYSEKEVDAAFPAHQMRRVVSRGDAQKGFHRLGLVVSAPQMEQLLYWLDQHSDEGGATVHALKSLLLNRPLPPKPVRTSFEAVDRPGHFPGLNTSREGALPTSPRRDIGTAAPGIRRSHDGTSVAAGAAAGAVAGAAADDEVASGALGVLTVDQRRACHLTAMRANAIIKACDAADVDGSGVVGWPVFRDSLAKVDIIVEDTELVAVGAAVTELAPGAEASVAEPSDYQVPYTRLVPRLRFFLDSDVRGELRLPLRGPVKDPNYEYNMAVAQAQADRRAAEAAARAAEQAARLAHQQGAHVPEMSEAERLAQAFARADQAVQNPQALATAQLAEQAEARAKAAQVHVEAQAKARAEAEARAAAEAAAASRPPAGGHQIPSHVFSEVTISVVNHDLPTNTV